MSTNFNGFVGWYVVCEQPLLYKVKVSEQGCPKCKIHTSVKFCPYCGTKTKEEVEIIKDTYHSIHDIVEESGFSKQEKSIYNKVVSGVVDFIDCKAVLLLKGVSLEEGEEGCESVNQYIFHQHGESDYRKLRPIIKRLYNKTKLCFGKVCYSA